MIRPLFQEFITIYFRLIFIDIILKRLTTVTLTIKPLLDIKRTTLIYFNLYFYLKGMKIFQKQILLKTLMLMIEPLLDMKGSALIQ